VIDEVVGIRRFLNLRRRLVLPRAISNGDVFIEQVPDVRRRSRVGGRDVQREDRQEGDRRGEEKVPHCYLGVALDGAVRRRRTLATPKALAMPSRFDDKRSRRGSVRPVPAIG
jgi:hypothetical protein